MCKIRTAKRIHVPQVEGKAETKLTWEYLVTLPPLPTRRLSFFTPRTLILIICTEKSAGRRTSNAVGTHVAIETRLPIL